jgi:hypothetical protein
VHCFTTPDSRPFREASVAIKMCIISRLRLPAFEHAAVHNQRNQLTQITLPASDAAPLVSANTLQDFPSRSSQVLFPCFSVVTNSVVIRASRICRSHDVKHERSCSAMCANRTSTAPGVAHLRRRMKQTDSASEFFAALGLLSPAGMQNPDPTSLRELLYSSCVSSRIIAG